MSSPDLVPVAESVDLTENSSLLVVDISDALSERDWVKFTVHTRTTLPVFQKSEFSVTRLHQEFIWLHDTFADNSIYDGYIIPPPPPKPDFDSSREKLRRLGDAEGNLTKEEFEKMKLELEAEYLATFKKTVAMHETFLCRLVAHPIFRQDQNLLVFLEYEKELEVRGKNKKERLVDFFNMFQKSSDELLLGSTVKDIDEDFEVEKNHLIEYYGQLKECVIRCDKMTSVHKALADNYIKVSSALTDLSGLENSSNSSPSFLNQLSDALERVRRIEARVASDQDLKLSDQFRYHQRDTSAAKDLLYRRLRCLANYEKANRNLDQARARNREVAFSEAAQNEACSQFEIISDRAKSELSKMKERRVEAIQRSLAEMAEFEVKHSKAHANMLRSTLATLKLEA